MYQYNYKISKPKKSFAKRIFLPLITAILLGAIAWAVQASHLLEYRHIIVKGDNEARTKSIQDFLAANTRFLLSSPSGATSLVLSRYPDVGEISSGINYFSKTLTVSYKSRASHFLWCKANQASCLLVDANGMVFATSPISQASFLTKIQDNYLGPLQIGSKIPNNTLKPLLDIETAFKKINVPIDYVLLEYLFSLKVIGVNSPEVRFTFLEPTADQLKNFSVLYDSLSSDEFHKLQYIDVRIKDKVYYK